jgi:predicted dehydrogenase
MLRVGLVGYGYWGPNLARNFSANPDCRLVRVCDLSAKRRAVAQATFPWIETTDDASMVTKGKDVDVAVIATPVGHHYEIAKAALLRGKHVWIEKPMASTVAQGQELTELADSRGLTLAVDHTFLFTGAVQRMKELIDSGELGELYYYDAVRVNLGLFQSDVNVICDLAPHDLSIMDYLLGPSARAISAQGRSHFDTGLEDVAYLCVYYDNNLIAHVHLNWLSPVKIRQILVGGSKKMLMWDDVRADEKLKVYSRGVQITTSEERNRILAEYRMGDMWSPALPNVEALQAEVAYFVDCIARQQRPHNDGHAGVRILSMLEAAERSLRNKGSQIELSPSPPGLPYRPPVSLVGGRKLA